MLPLAARTWADEVWLILLDVPDYALGELPGTFPSDQTDKLNQDIVSTLRWVHAARLLIEQGHSEANSDGSNLLQLQES